MLNEFSRKLGDEDYNYKWNEGAMTESGIIYCPPYGSRRGILKIDTNADTVTVLNRNLQPEPAGSKWFSCAAALDGCIYFMPHDARRIMKLDPNNNDEMTSVGDELGNRCYSRTVVGVDGCVYGIPSWDNHGGITKYDPFNDTTSFAVKRDDEAYFEGTRGALGRDGCIYVVARGRILKIDTTDNSSGFVGNIEFYSDDCGDAILGIDGCIYWPPAKGCHILKYDPLTNQTSLVRDDYGFSSHKQWSSGCLASNGVIYCIPNHAERILSSDPWKELCTTVKNNIQEHPQNFGFLFERPEQRDFSTLSHQTKIGHNAAPRKCTTRYKAVVKFVQQIKVFEKCMKPPLYHVYQTNFDHAVVKFGRKKVIEVLDEYMTPVNDFCRHSNLCPFMIVASYKESSVCDIYHFLRQDLSWVNGIGKRSVEVKAQQGSALHVHGAAYVSLIESYAPELILILKFV